MWNETIPLLAASANLLLGFLIIVNAPDRPLHRAFFLLMGVSFVWNFGTFRFSATSAIFWHRTLTLGSVLLPAAAFRFFSFFLGMDDATRARWTRVLLGVSAALFLFAFTPLFATTPFRVALSAYVAALLSGLAIAAQDRYRQAEVPLERHRLAYVFAVLGITAAAVILDTTRDLGFPIVRLGNLASLFTAVILTFAIIRHRLLDLQVVLRGSLIFAVLVVMAVPLHRLLYATQHSVSYTTIATEVFLLLLATAVIFPWTTRWAHTGLTRAVLGSRSGRRGMLRQMRARISRGEMEARDLGEPLAAAREGLHAEWIAVIQPAEGERSALVSGRGPIPDLDPLGPREIASLKRMESTVYRSELAIGTGNPGPAAAACLHAMEAIGAELLAPVKAGGAPAALLLAGPHRDATAYDALDIAFFGELAQEVGAVLQNAHARRALEARSRLAAIGEMSAAVAHEVRNPLAAMKGAVEILNRKSDPREAPERKLFGLLAGEIERLEHVVTDFLEYAQPKPPNRTPEKLEEVVRRSLELLRQDPELARVAFEASPAGDLPPVALDAEQIRQVLINLVRNSAQAMGGEGRIALAVERRGAEAILRLADSGPGFDAQALRQGFEPFFTTRSRGSGLGLAIVRRIVEYHGGRIALRNRDTGGAEVTVALPIAGDETRDVAPGRDAP